MQIVQRYCDLYLGGLKYFDLFVIDSSFVTKKTYFATIV